MDWEKLYESCFYILPFFASFQHSSFIRPRYPSHHYSFKRRLFFAGFLSARPSVHIIVHKRCRLPTPEDSPTRCGVVRCGTRYQGIERSVMWMHELLLQRRLDLALSQSSANLVGGILLGTGCQKFAPSLSHVVFLLHGGELLVFGEGQSKRDAEKQGRGGNHPSTLSAERQNAPSLVRDGANSAGDPTSRRRWNNVAQGIQALCQSLI